MIAAVLLALVGVGIAVGAVPTGRQDRDVPAFQRDALLSQQTSDAQVADGALLRAHPDLVLAEGDRACAWLVGQPTAPDVDPSGRSAVRATTTRYLAASPGGPLDAVTPLTREVVVLSAWNHLCHDERTRALSPARRPD